MPLRTPKRFALDRRPDAVVRSPKQESEVAARVGGKVVKRSGAGSEKGDCRVSGFVRIECKTTSAKSFSVTLDMLDKLEHAAMVSGELPVLVVEFLKNGKPWRSVCVVTDSVLDLLGGLQ